MYLDNNQKQPIGNKKDPSKLGAIPKIYFTGWWKWKYGRSVHLIAQISSVPIITENLQKDFADIRL